MSVRIETVQKYNISAITYTFVIQSSRKFPDFSGTPGLASMVRTRVRSFEERRNLSGLRKVLDIVLSCWLRRDSCKVIQRSGAHPSVVCLSHLSSPHTNTHRGLHHPTRPTYVSSLLLKPDPKADALVISRRDLLTYMTKSQVARVLCVMTSTSVLVSDIFTPPAIGEWTIVTSVSVCLSVASRSHSRE